VDELKRQLIDVWCGLQQSIFDEAILTIERVSMLREDIMSTACERTMLILSIYVTFSMTSIIDLTLASLITKLTLANTFLFILQGSA